ncbi:hypothetical protein V8F20_002290 [Naviculisporaceae sp. PSN 640]
MGLQLESLSKSSFEQYGPWHFHDIRFKRDEPVNLDKAILSVSSIPGLNDRLSEISRSGKEKLQGTFGSFGSTSPVPPPVKSMSASTFKLDSSTQASSSKLIAASSSPPIPKAPCVDSTAAHAVFLTAPFEVSSPAPRPSLKRRRPDTDVDGPDTSTLSCKKRRLLRHLITSRLSEPFSTPATHILNRESVASGDRRFLKLATILAARRMNYPGTQNLQPHPSQSSILRRTAIFNCVRLRHHIQVQPVAPRVENEAEELARGSALRQIFAPSTVSMPRPPFTSPSLPTPMPRDSGGQPVLARTATGSGPAPPGSPPGPRPAEGGSLLRLPSPRLSPRLRPIRSPELRMTRPAREVVDFELEADDGETAFPSSEHESRYEDEPDDHVYTDFSLIFGGGDDGDFSDEENTADNFEDVLDDLDGIPWNARC